VVEPAPEAVVDESTAALDALREGLGNVLAALVWCRNLGMPPAEALGYVGIETPGFAAPIINAQLGELLDAAEESSTEGLQS
jgi:hypothetical protein